MCILKACIHSKAAGRWKPMSSISCQEYSRKVILWQIVSFWMNMGMKRLGHLCMHGPFSYRQYFNRQGIDGFLSAISLDSRRRTGVRCLIVHAYACLENGPNAWLIDRTRCGGRKRSWEKHRNLAHPLVFAGWVSDHHANSCLITQTIEADTQSQGK